MLQAAPDDSTGLAKPGLIVVGASHRSSSLGLRDALYTEDEDIPGLLDRVRAAGVAQAVVLSTCDRVEVIAAHTRPQEAISSLVGVLAERAALEPAEILPQLYRLEGQEALRHLFAVASALDSQTIGEPQVLGQVKAAHRLARDHGMTGPELEAALQAAYGTAKRVRAETAIGERPVSMATAAVELARDLHGDLAACRGLMIGAGEMGELVAETLLRAGLSRLETTSPIPARAESLARRLDCHVAPWEDLANRLAEADIVLTSVGTRRYILTADMVRSALKRRRRRPVFLIDAAIPGDIEPAVNRIDEAFLYDLDDLERVALEGRVTREAASRAAWDIVAVELACFQREQAERAAVPVLVALRQRFEAVRDEILGETGNDADRATRLLVNRLLHDPQEVLKGIAARPGGAGGDWDVTERVLRRLFRLPEAGRPDDDPDDGQDNHLGDDKD